MRPLVSVSISERAIYRLCESLWKLESGGKQNLCAGEDWYLYGMRICGREKAFLGHFNDFALGHPNEEGIC